MLGHSSAGGFDSSAGNVGIAGDGIELATAGFDADGDDTEPETAGANSVVENARPAIAGAEATEDADAASEAGAAGRRVDKSGGAPVCMNVPWCGGPNSPYCELG
jgi:hypothetical protein